MNTNKHFSFTTILCTFSLYLIAQGKYEVGSLPAINFNYKLQNNWSVNVKLESRQSFQTGTFNGNRERNLEYLLTDYSIIAAKKVGLSSRIAGGYLFRSRGGELVHRAIQQFTVVQRLPRFRLAHRFVADQTKRPFLPSWEYRLRYRLASELPLNGRSADPKEFYIKISNEYLNSLNKRGNYDLEVRFVPLLGYSIREKHKVELGLDYRVNSFLNNPSRHRFWASINYYIEL